MKTDFEHWLAAQFGETGPFTLFILLMKIGADDACSTEIELCASDRRRHDLGGDAPLSAALQLTACTPISH